MQRKGRRPRAIRTSLLALLCVAALGLLLTQCPANRDGAPGRLAQAMEESTAAARSGALALDLFHRGRSTAQLAAVQLSDARDEAVKAYQGIAELRVQDPVDVGRQGMLANAVTGIITELNTASVAVRGVPGQPPLPTLHDRLLTAAATLESGYR
ncbi:uncharacterized protein RMCC_6008 [Mycolicibacterium canariasense]|uniref:Uncharacterized protein n=1 Tax=Mycolicibacterium canariasense TaxID=228230 RepID=A0A100WJ86_MYCCR|nr:hypothetical protein [Mycolicibacterium canariasense]MCV7208213.1 hypothetical protein [Mycolicibacterium canariasense]ORV09451.1 hypothetical protein AWB94_09335 [Mycolicibacterium canariasense]GAS99043.1 uncharacterized protein RMCC_6008 [Mycolicibacterium canariasense]